MNADQERTASLVQSARLFISDFIQFAGRGGAYAAILVALGALLEGISLALIIPLLALVTIPAHSLVQTKILHVMAFLGARDPLAQIAILLATFSIAMVLRAFTLAARDIQIGRLQTGFVDWLRTTVMKALAATRWDHLARLQHSRITQIISGETQRVASLTHFLLQSAVAAAMLCAQCVLAGMISFRLTLCVLALFALAGAVTIRMLRHSRHEGTQVTASSLQLLSITSNFLGGLKLAASQGQQASFVEEFRATQQQLFDRQNSHTRKQAIGRASLSSLSAIVGAVAILVGLGVFGLPTTTLVALLIILARMNGPVTLIQQSMQQLAFGLPAYERIAGLRADLRMAAAPNTSEVADIFPGRPHGVISFHHVTFRHRHASGVTGTGVKDLSLSIAPGTFVGVVGSSGSGKTTFADILAGLYPPQIGQVTIGDVPLAGGELAAWRNNISYLPQDSYLFHESIRRNLNWARPGAIERDLWQALELAGAASLVRGLPQGLDTVVGERGTLLSGGERQRISIARALLREPAILILDEATSAIDEDGERLLIQRLLALSPRPTIVLITHRLASTAACDDVLSFADGRIEHLTGQHRFERAINPIHST